MTWGGVIFGPKSRLTVAVRKLGVHFYVFSLSSYLVFFSVCISIINIEICLYCEMYFYVYFCQAPTVDSACSLHVLVLSGVYHWKKRGFHGCTILLYAARS